MAPTVTFVGNKGSYGLLDTVTITCTVADAAPSSGIKTNPCSGFTISGPAWSFKLGANTLPSPGLVATDNAANSSAAATTTFTVSTTSATLGQLTLQFIQSSAKYAALSPAQKQVVNALANAATQILTAITPKLSPLAKAALENSYKSAVQSLVTQGWLTSGQGATLDTFVTGL